MLLLLYKIGVIIGNGRARWYYEGEPPIRPSAERGFYRFAEIKQYWHKFWLEPAQRERREREAKKYYPFKDISDLLK